MKLFTGFEQAQVGANFYMISYAQQRKSIVTFPIFIHPATFEILLWKMERYEKIAVELVTMWVERSIGSQESFGYLISTFIKEHPSIETKEDLERILLASKRIATKIIKEYPSDAPLLLSYKAFSSALDHFIAYLN
jgi:hypothetical protein